MKVPHVCCNMGNFFSWKGNFFATLHFAQIGRQIPKLGLKSAKKSRFLRKIEKNHKKMHFFCKKFWRIKILPYICSVKRKQPDDKHNWSIHLRARIPASHAGHRGSNPLSTTKRRLSVVFFLCLYPPSWQVGSTINFGSVPIYDYFGSL